MSNDQSIHALTCPNCGGNVDLPPGQDQTTCKFCGTRVERERPAAPPPVVIRERIVRQPVYVRTAVPIQRSSGCGVAVLILGITAAVLAAIFAIVSSQNGGRSIFSSVRALDTAMIVPGGDGQLPIALLLTHNNDTDKSGLGLVSPISQTTRWQNEYFDKDTYSVVMTTGGNLVYTVDKTRLLALNRDSGQIVWQTSLSDEVSTSCHGCLQVVGKQLVALTKDGTLQSFDAQTGRVARSKRLSSTPDRLSVIRDQLLVIDRDNGDAFVSILDPATGKEVQHLTPQCTADPESLPDTLETDAAIVIDSDQSLYLMYGTFTACVQRWDVTSGKLTWQTGLKDASFIIADDIYPLVSDDSVFVSGRNALYAVSKKDGKPRELINNADYDFVPLAIHANTLIVRAKRTRGSTRYELWGVDIPSGKQLWQHPFAATEPLDEPDRMAGLIDNTDSGFTAHLTPTGLVIVAAKGEPHQLVLETLDPESGTSAGEKTIGLNVSGDFYSVPDVVGWTNDTGYFIIEGQLYVVNLTLGTATYVW